MCKYIRLLLVFLFLSGNLSQAAETQYLLKSFEKCSVQNQCADVVNSVKKLHEPPVVDIMDLKNIIPQQVVQPQEEKIVSYRIPQEAYTKPLGQIYKKSTTYISNIDPYSGEPGVNTNYPGLRGANQLIVYTPAFGLKTGTNEFGAEAVVVKNTVVKLSGADSLIPREGFVISGHGSAKTWIQQNIILGSKIYIDPNDMKITSFVTPDTYVFEAQEKIKETTNVIKYYKMMDNNYDSRKSVHFLNKANDSVKRAEKHPDKAEHYLIMSKEFVDASLQYAIPYKQDEFKGVWIRPTEHSEREIKKTVDAIKEAGINNIFLETYYHGTTIYPSAVLQKYGITPQRNEFRGFDPLKTWIEESRKNNIKVHIWFESFYVGNKPPRSSMKHILSAYPDWANTTKAMADSSEIASSAAEHNGYFIDPANPAVQQYVGELLTEIIEKYHPDGINLDYIRYPQCATVKRDNSSGTEWGYTKYAREEFKSLYGVDPLTLKVSDPLRAKWFEYRQNKVTDFVKFARKITSKNNVMLTTVIFTDRQRSLDTKMQDWKTWSRKNLVDGFTPLLLTTDKRTAGTLIHDMKSQMYAPTKLYPGIFVMFMNAPTDELLMQVHETRKMHSDGVILFDYAHFHQKYRDALQVRAFNEKRF